MHNVHPGDCPILASLYIISGTSASMAGKDYFKTHSGEFSFQQVWDLLSSHHPLTKILEHHDHFLEYQQTEMPFQYLQLMPPDAF